MDNKLTISNIIRSLIIFMVIFVSLVVVVSIVRGIYDINGIVIGLAFIIILMFLKWSFKEMNIE